MKKIRREELSKLFNLAITLALILGLFSGSPLSKPDSAYASHRVAAGNGGIELTQVSPLHLSTSTGVGVTFAVTIENPVETDRYNWTVLNPPKHGEVYTEPQGAVVTGVYTPLAVYNGSDYFVISVHDQSGSTARIGVAVEIQPVPSHDAWLPGEPAPQGNLPGISRLINSQVTQPGSNDLLTNGSGSSQPMAEVWHAEQGGNASTEISFMMDGTFIERTDYFGPAAPSVTFGKNPIGVERPEFTAASVLLSDVPIFTFVFGSAAVSAAMIAGYYDRTGFSNMYTGPTNGGVAPLTDTIWGTWVDGAGVSYPNNPLAASRNGVDGRTTHGTIDDYWVDYASDAPDPYLTNGWTEHTWGDAIGDYMGTSQSAWSNPDGFTTFHAMPGSPLPMTCDEFEVEHPGGDGTLGIRHFYEARGYAVGSCYFQHTDNRYAGGFSLQQFQTEIDAGYPVMIHLGDHTMVGVGYEPGTSTIYIHDAWLSVVNTMEWGSKYLNLEMSGVSIVHPVRTPVIDAAPQTDEVWGTYVLPSTEVILTIGLYTTSSMADAGGDVYFDLGGEFDIVPGTEITINDGVNSTVYTVAELSITKVSVNDDRVWGSAAYDVNPIWVYGCDGSYCVRDEVWTVASSNEWLADFSDLSYDLANGDLVIAVIPDAAGNRTVVTWQVSNPHMIVDPNEDIVFVYDWYVEDLDELSYSHPLELRINDTLVDTRRTDTEMNCVYPNLPVDILAGHRLEVRGDIKIIEHVVKLLKIKAIDLAADTVRGKAIPGEIVYIVASDPASEAIFRTQVTAGEDGVWLVDLSGKVDIAPGIIIDAYVFDAAGNATRVSGHIPTPAFSIDPILESVSGWDWAPGKTAVVSVGAFQASLTVDSYGKFYLNLSGLLDLRASQIMSVTDGSTTKSHVIRNLSIDEINDIDELITGSAEPGSQVKVVTFDIISSGTELSIQTDGLGEWQADLSGLEDLAQRTWGWADQEDEDGDRTTVSFSIPDYPYLEVLGPRFGVAGQPSMTIIAYGGNYAPTSRVRFNGVERETTFVSESLLSTVLSESDLAEPGPLIVDVYTPSPGGGISASERFDVIDVSPQYDGQLNSNYVDFSWQGISGASQYKIQFSSEKDFSVLLLNTKTTSPWFTAYDVPLVRGRTYYWRFRPFYGALKGPWSVVMPFHALDPLSAPDLLTTEIDGYLVTMNWSPVEGAVKYKLQIAKDLAFTNLVFNAPVFSPETSKLLVLPEKVKTYYWRVKAIDEVKIKSAWSEIGQFTVPLQ